MHLCIVSCRLLHGIRRRRDVPRRAPKRCPMARLWRCPSHRHAYLPRGPGTAARGRASGSRDRRRQKRLQFRLGPSGVRHGSRDREARTSSSTGSASARTSTRVERCFDTGRCGGGQENPRAAAGRVTKPRKRGLSEAFRSRDVSSMSRPRASVSRPERR